jgi:hypothetical protein
MSNKPAMRVDMQQMLQISGLRFASGMILRYCRIALQATRPHRKDLGEVFSEEMTGLRRQQRRDW